LVFVLALLVMSAVGVWAQSTATLSGVVTDPSGAVVPGVHITVRSLGTGIDRETVTDDAGLYAFPSLQPGDYQLQATSGGFAQFIMKKVTLNVDQRAAVNIGLTPASTAQTVEVEGTSSI
jgi:hypothetical protein